VVPLLAPVGVPVGGRGGIAALPAAVDALGQDVEDEGVDVVVERLVVEEELGDEAEVLAVERLARAGDAPQREPVVDALVHLAPGRVARVRPGIAREVPLRVAPRGRAARRVSQRVVAHVERRAVVLLGERRPVPRLDLVARKNDLRHVLDARHLLARRLEPLGERRVRRRRAQRRVVVVCGFSVL